MLVGSFYRSMEQTLLFVFADASEVFCSGDLVLESDDQQRRVEVVVKADACDCCGLFHIFRFSGHICSVWLKLIGLGALPHHTGAACFQVLVVLINAVVSEFLSVKNLSGLRLVREYFFTAERKNLVILHCDCNF